MITTTGDPGLTIDSPSSVVNMDSPKGILINDQDEENKEESTPMLRNIPS